MSRLKDVPELARDGSNLSAVIAAVREVIQTFRGYRGDPMDAALTRRTATEVGLLNTDGSAAAGSGGVGPAGPQGPAGPAGPAGTPYTPDMTPPPTAAGLSVTAGIGHLYISCDQPIYTQGHGHDLTVVYGAKWPIGGTVPTFSGAVELMRFQGTFSAYASDPSTRWCIWIKWLSNDDVLSTSPAGGTNGVQATTGQDVSALLAALTGEITSSELHSALGTRIDLIDAADNVAGSVAQRVLAEATARGTAISSEATARMDADTAITTTATALAARVDRVRTWENTANVNGNNAALIEVSLKEGDGSTPLKTGDAAFGSSKGTISYMVEARVTSTGTPTGATSVFTSTWNGSAWVWSQTVVYEAGVVSNHVRLYLSGGVPTVRLYDHTATYNITYNVRTKIGGYSAEAAIVTEQSARASADTAISTAATTLTARVTATEGGISTNSAAITTEQTVRASQTGDLYAQYTVKLDVNGKVSGFGLASTGPTGTGSVFEIRADKFSIAAPTGTAAGAVPFSVLTAPTSVGGITLPAGVYAQNAFIQDGQITNAKIVNLAVDNAKIANMSVAKLTAGGLAVGQYVRSTSYTPGSAGFSVNADGTAEFNSVTVRGTVYATAGEFRGVDVKNAAGVVILSSGSTIQSQIAPYASGATVGAPSGSYVGATLAQTVESNASTALANAATAQTAANTANTALANIASDSILSPSEKPSVVQDYTVITGEQAGIDAQATAYSITTEKTAYDTAVTALTTYLGTLTGWNTVPGADVAIVGTTFRTKFSDVYTARQALLTKIAQVAGTQASWSGVSGAGKPSDNATVGATIGVNLSGQITSGNASTFIANAAITDAQIGTLNASKIVAGTITTDKLVANAATVASVVTANSTTVFSATPVTSLTVPTTNITTFASTGSRLKLLGHLHVSVVLPTPTSVYQVDLTPRVSMDIGTGSEATLFEKLIRVRVCSIILPIAGYNVSFTIPIISSNTPSAGNHTFEYNCLCEFRDSGGNAVANSAPYANITSRFILEENKV